LVVAEMVWVDLEEDAEVGQAFGAGHFPDLGAIHADGNSFLCGQDILDGREMHIV
jgi:hypothetical protein